MYGNERVRVLDYTLEGKVRSVPADATSFVAGKRHYRNDWLGIAFDLPSGYEFAETDIMYPRSDVVVLRGADGATITVAQRSVHAGGGADLPALLREQGYQGTPQSLEVAGRQAWLAEKDDATLVVWQHDSDLWSVSGRGDQVEAGIRALLAGFK